MSATKSSPAFSSAWWMLPLATRFLSVIAMKAGITAQVEIAHLSDDYTKTRPKRPIMFWRGSISQLLSTGLLHERKVPSVGRSRWTCIHDLRGTLVRLNADEFSYSIDYCNETSTIRVGKYATAARSDQSFLNFRDAVMVGFPRADLGCES